ncbi:protein ATAF2-like [Pyrus ussuriensis x Pyrus communis]|uniref:Protein ATAF2-like n=1 Tax=Pyrus ussuriensis x Pyrus communis TaxID=2448454 RepID=A0A5N5GPE5_9ROSA|nr:protein ATAF2-like [Pyrus ussuriensis x Pyrus communis]
MGLGGTWEGKSVPAWVEGTEGNSTCIGLKRTFWYKNEGSEEHGGWKLDEYSLFASPRKRNSHTSYDFDSVLCRLRNTSGINRRKCSTSSSQDDEVLKKKKRANKDIEKDDQAGSEQSMNVINVEEEEGRQGNSCLTSNLVVSDHEINELTAGDDVDYGYDDNDARLTITVAKLDDILAKEPTDGAVEVLLPTASASEESLLAKERQEVPLLVSSNVVVADGEVEDQALNPNMLEKLIPETRELTLPASSGAADEDGTVEEKAWDPSLLEQYWLAETQEEEPLNPSFYRGFMFAIGGVEEAYHPSAFDNLVDQSLFGISLLE